jgi:hypothetical protein
VEELLFSVIELHNVSGVQQIEVHTAKPLVPGPSRLEDEIAIETLNMYKSPGSVQILAELIQTKGKTKRIIHSKHLCLTLTLI